MAITAVHYFLIRSMFENGLLPQGGAILEIGEANLYGDVAAETLAEDIRKYVADPVRRDKLLARHAELAASPQAWTRFDQAKLFYEVFFAPAQVQAIDFHGSPLAQKLDLNHPVKLDRKFDVSINHGTAEHVFDVAQVFRTMHDYTVPGGTMIHGSPFTGWIEHGFYTFQPTLFVDLAQFNQYQIRGIFVMDIAGRTVTPLNRREDVYQNARAGKIPRNSNLFVVLRKGMVDRPFQFPIQGYYRGVLPPAGVEAWLGMR
jgi:hypothetical protein